MNTKRAGFLLIGMVALIAVAAERPSTNGVIQIGHDKVQAAFVKGGTLLATNNFKVMALKRDAPGEVEIHERDTDIFYVLEGSANLVTGGAVTESRTSGPGETRGKGIVGGDERKVTKGDVVIIPNGVAHWFKDVQAPFLYYMVKVSN